jgi:tetratricopeptide (TPR) repeat protein
MRCHDCGWENPTEARFCGGCGKQFVDSTPSADLAGRDIREEVDSSTFEYLIRKERWDEIVEILERAGRLEHTEALRYIQAFKDATTALTEEQWADLVAELLQRGRVFTFFALAEAIIPHVRNEKIADSMAMYLIACGSKIEDARGELMKLLDEATGMSGIVVYIRWRMLNELSKYYINKGEFDEAKELLETLLSLSMELLEETPRILGAVHEISRRLCFVYGKLKNVDWTPYKELQAKLVPLVEKSDLDPLEKAIAFYMMAVSCFRTGDEGEAYRYLDRIVDMTRHAPSVHGNPYQWCDILKGCIYAAWTYSKRSIHKDKIIKLINYYFALEDRDSEWEELQDVLSILAQLTGAEGLVSLVTYPGVDSEAVMKAVSIVTEHIQ